MIKLLLVIFIIYLIIGNFSTNTNGSSNHIITSGKIDPFLIEYSPTNNHAIGDITRDNDGKNKSSKSLAKRLKGQILDNIKFKKSSNTTDAPVLENYLDYAPVDMKFNVQHYQKPPLVMTKTNSSPKPSNSFDKLHQSKYESEFRTSSMEKQGNDDLSRLFQTDKPSLISPEEWETKK